MCVVSVVVSASQQQWGNISNWPLPVAIDMTEIIKRLSEIDKKLGARDCYDPTKDEFIKALEKRVNILEAFVREEKIAKTRANEDMAFGTHVQEAVAVPKDMWGRAAKQDADPDHEIRNPSAL